VCLSGAGVSKLAVHTVETSGGPALVHLSAPCSPHGLVLLGHSAGGGAAAPVLVAGRDRLVESDVAVGLVEQPYRVAGRRMPDPAPVLDRVMTEVARWARGAVPGVALVLGGKSSGARVGCRVAEPLGAVGVVALGFPLVPPRRPGRSRAGELDAGCPVLVVQGTRDAFGTPDEVRSAAGDLPVTVHEVTGADHSFTARRADGRSSSECAAEAADVVADWVLARVRSAGPA